MRDTGDLDELAQGHVLKLLYQQRDIVERISLPVHVTLLHRDPAQVAASWRATFGRPWGDADDYQLLWARWHQTLTDLPNLASLSVVDHAQLMSEPLVVFDELARRGWPLDGAAASAGIRPDWWRHRSEQEGDDVSEAGHG